MMIFLIIYIVCMVQESILNTTISLLLAQYTVAVTACNVSIVTPLFDSVS